MLEYSTIATFADDRAIMAVGTAYKESTRKLQNSIDQINDWTKRWHQYFYPTPVSYSVIFNFILIK